jgi:hypothetical protein
MPRHFLSRFQLVEPECTKCLLKAWVNKAPYLSRYHQCALLDGETLHDPPSMLPRLGSSPATSNPTSSSTKQLVAQLLHGLSTPFFAVRTICFFTMQVNFRMSCEEELLKRAALTTTTVGSSAAPVTACLLWRSVPVFAGSTARYPGTTAEQDLEISSVDSATLWNARRLHKQSQTSDTDTAYLHKTFTRAHRRKRKPGTSHPLRNFTSERTIIRTHTYCAHV